MYSPHLPTITLRSHVKLNKMSEDLSVNTPVKKKSGQEPRSKVVENRSGLNYLKKIIISEHHTA